MSNAELSEQVLLVIPARLASTRLPEKPLAALQGYPLLWWVWQNALASRFQPKVVIATDSTRIMECLQGYGAEVLLTSPRHQAGTDRVFEAAQSFPEYPLIVNLQGDEPFLQAEIIDACLQTMLTTPQADITTPVVPFLPSQNTQTPSLVKAVANLQGKALYFSRAPLANGQLHLGLYVYRRPALALFCSKPPSPLEQAERLEQLRALEAGLNIWLVPCPHHNRLHFGIDTPEDLNLARKLIESSSPRAAVK